MKRELELYVHIPFCIKKCAYCDFLSGPADDGKKLAYVDALVEEIRRCGDFSAYTVTSIFFGGGTPSVLPGEWMERIMEEIREHFCMDPKAEITTEANPGTVDPEKLNSYRRAGFNRISFGCQSADDQELKRLGRIHTWEQFLESYNMARKAGFRNINVDLMSGLPGQSLTSWEETLKKVAALETEHISAYSLIVEEGTPFYAVQDQLELPDEETERLMYERTAEILREYGYEQYEISNYGRPGYACRHNIGYWTGRQYLGLGLGASSLIDNCRFCNTNHMETYLTQMAGKDSRHSCMHENEMTASFENPAADAQINHILQDVNVTGIREEIQKLSEQDRMEEFMILGLRLTQGVSEADFERLFHIKIDQVYGEILKKYCSAGFLKRERGRIFFTREGISVSNTILSEMLL